MTDLTHPDPEVRQLAELAEHDDDFEFMIVKACRSHGCANLTELFERVPDDFFELHEAMMMIAEQLPPPEVPDIDAIRKMLDDV